MRASILIKEDRGVATSLLETVLVIAIVALLSGIAFVAAIDNIEQAKFIHASADAEQIALAIHSFMQDTGFAPAYRSGDSRSGDDAIFLVLETGGNDPTVADTLNWPSDPYDRDHLENHLVKNRPEGTGTPYPRMGEITWARHKGWNGPYLSKLPTSDPWNDKYLVNVQLLTRQGVQMASETLTLEQGQRAAVFVVSAGANRVLETRFDQVAESFIAGGDDIVFRIQ